VKADRREFVRARSRRDSVANKANGSGTCQQADRTTAAPTLTKPGFGRRKVSGNQRRRIGEVASCSLRCIGVPVQHCLHPFSVQWVPIGTHRIRKMELRLADDLQFGSAETVNQSVSGHFWPAFNRWRRSENSPSIAVCGFSSQILTPEAQSTFAAIDFLSVADKANEAVPLQPPKDPEKKLRLRVRPSHQLLTDFRVPGPLRLVENDDVFRWLRSVRVLLQITKEVLDRRVSLILGRRLRLACAGCAIRR